MQKTKERPRAFDPNPGGGDGSGGPNDGPASREAMQRRLPPRLRRKMRGVDRDQAKRYRQRGGE
jgi:hypothetical protein